MNTLSKIKDMLLAARDIAVYCHTNPDGDTLACALALRRALAAKAKPSLFSATTRCPNAMRSSRAPNR